MDETIDLSDEHGQSLLAAIGDAREPVLYRWTPPARGEDDFSDEPLEYAVCSLPEPCYAGYGGVMLWGRYERGWIANPGGRSLVSHLLAIAKAAKAYTAAHDRGLAAADCGDMAVLAASKGEISDALYAIRNAVARNVLDGKGAAS